MHVYGTMNRESTTVATPTWQIHRTDTNEVIGEVRWHGAESAYAFWPWQNTPFDSTALQDLGAFCESMTIQFPPQPVPPRITPNWQKPQPDADLLH